MLHLLRLGFSVRYSRSYATYPTGGSKRVQGSPKVLKVICTSQTSFLWSLDTKSQLILNKKRTKSEAMVFVISSATVVKCFAVKVKNVHQYPLLV